MDRCTGHCCKAFSLPYSLDDMRRLYKGAVADLGKRNYTTEDRRLRLLDMVKIYPILVPLSGGRPGTHPDGPSRQSGTRYYYTCRHFKDGQCTNYERRPQMCRNYPAYHSKELCEYAACTWDDHHGRRARGLRVVQEGPCVNAPEYGMLLKQPEGAVP